MTKHTIDCEPTWEAILDLAKHGSNPALIEELRPACKIADMVRQAQKKGKAQIVFKLDNPNGQVEVLE